MDMTGQAFIDMPATDHGLKIFSSCPVSAQAQSERCVRELQEFARASEDAGHEGALVFTDNSQLDPWLVSQIIVECTERLCPLVAIQPAYMHPYSVAKMIASFAHLYRRRLYLNMVAGGFKNDLLALNDLTPHDERYARLLEYTTVIHSLLQTADPVSFEGRYYKVTNLKLTPPLPAELMPGVLVSGSSEAGMDAARQLKATAVEYPKPPAEYADAFPANITSKGIRIGVIARSEDAEAWSVARARYPEDRKGQLTHQLAMKVSDSSWHQQLSELGKTQAGARCRRGDRLGLVLPKMPTAIVAMLGALKADAIYVLLDPASPAARQARILQVSDCRCILTAGPVSQNLRDALAAATLAQPPMIGWLDEGAPSEADPAPAFTLHDLPAYPAAPPACAHTDNDVAHILFTSGSTGTPKGVMITHASVAHFLGWASRYFGTAPSDRISQHPPLYFDLSTFDIFGTLWAGAELHLVPQELNLLPHKLAQFIREARLTQWFSAPSVLNLMAKFDVIAQNDFPSLRRVMWCGEAIPTPTLIHWMKRLPHARFTNLYGPTVATIASSYYAVPRCPRDEREPIPIGDACDGEELLVLDGRLQPVAAGDIGDLYIRGTGLSPGYWRDPEKTDRVFLPCPGGAGPRDRIYKTGDLARRGADGLFYFLGRADTQIKSRGYRIELGEIEAALHSLPALRESAVVAIQSDGFEGWLICCAYVLASDSVVSVEHLRQDLARLLPAYMLPTRWARHEALPQNANGKIG